MERPLDPGLVDLLDQVNLTADDVHRLIPTRRTIYQRLYVNSVNKLEAGRDYSLLHVGVGDLRNKINGSSSDNIDRTDTNILADGELPDGEVFVCTGIGVRLPHDAAIADVMQLEQTEVRVAKRGGKDGLILGQLVEMPPIHGVGYYFGFAGATETTPGTIARDRVRFEGAAYMGKTALFALKGGIPDAKRSCLKINSPVAVAPAGTLNPEFRLYGVWFQQPNDG